MGTVNEGRGVRVEDVIDAVHEFAGKTDFSDALERCEMASDIDPIRNLGLDEDFREFIGLSSGWQNEPFTSSRLEIGDYPDGAIGTCVGIIGSLTVAEAVLRMLVVLDEYFEWQGIREDNTELVNKHRIVAALLRTALDEAYPDKGSGVDGYVVLDDFLVFELRGNLDGPSILDDPATHDSFEA